MDEPEADAPRRRLFWPAFGLRWMFYLTAIAALTAAFVGLHIRREAIEVFGNLDGDAIHAICEAIKSDPEARVMAFTVESIAEYPARTNTPLARRLASVYAQGPAAQEGMTVVELEERKDGWVVTFVYDESQQ